MGILSKIGGFFVGGAATAGVDVATGIADIVERWKPGDAKVHGMTVELTKLVEESHADARRHDQPMSAGVKWIDSTVNGINRLVRPWVTITVLGSLFGYWELPPPENIAPQYWVMAQIVLSFWFGGRLVTKDVPQAITAFMGRKK